MTQKRHNASTKKSASSNKSKKNTSNDEASAPRATSSGGGAGAAAAVPHAKGGKAKRTKTKTKSHRNKKNSPQSAATATTSSSDAGAATTTTTTSPSVAGAASALLPNDLDNRSALQHLGYHVNQHNRKVEHQLFKLDADDIDVEPYQTELFFDANYKLKVSSLALTGGVEAAAPIEPGINIGAGVAFQQSSVQQEQSATAMMGILAYRECRVRHGPTTLLEKHRLTHTPPSGLYVQAGVLIKGFRIKITDVRTANNKTRSGGGNVAVDVVATTKAKASGGVTHKKIDEKMQVHVEMEILGQGWAPKFTPGLKNTEAVCALYEQLTADFNAHAAQMSGRFVKSRVEHRRYCGEPRYRDLLELMYEIENKIVRSAMPNNERLGAQFLQLESEIFAYLEGLKSDSDDAIFNQHVSRLHGFATSMANANTVFLNEGCRIWLPSTEGNAVYLSANTDATALQYSQVPTDFTLEAGTGADFYLKLQKNGNDYFCYVADGELSLSRERPQAQFYLQHNVDKPNTYLLVCKGWTLARQIQGRSQATLTTVTHDYLNYAQPVAPIPNASPYAGWKNQFERLVATIGNDISLQVKKDLGNGHQRQAPSDKAVTTDDTANKPTTGAATPTPIVDQQKLCNQHARIFVEDVLPEIREASKRDLVYVIGTTGAGKSTFINYMRGLQFRQDAELGNYNVVDPTKRHAKIGSPTDSETFYPSVYTDDKNNTFIDTPGFGETRADYKDIGALSMHVLQKAANQIRAIVVMISVGEIGYQKGKGLSQLYNNLQYFYQFGQLNIHPGANIFFIVNLKRTAGLSQKNVLARLQGFRKKTTGKYGELSGALDQYEHWWGDPKATQNELNGNAIAAYAQLARDHDIDIPTGELSSLQAKQLFQDLCRRREEYAQSLKVMGMISQDNLLTWDIVDGGACRQTMQTKLEAIPPIISIDKKKLRFAGETPEQVMLEKSIVDYIDEKRQALQMLLNKKSEQQQILDAQKRLPPIEIDKVNQRLDELFTLSAERLKELTEYTREIKLFDLFLQERRWKIFEPHTTTIVIADVKQSNIDIPYTRVCYRAVVDATPSAGLLEEVDMGDGLKLQRQHCPQSEALEVLDYPRGRVKVYPKFVSPEYKANKLFRSIEGKPRVGELRCLKVDDPRQKMNFNDAKKHLLLLFECWSTFVEQCAYLAVLDDAQPDTQPWSALRAAIAEWQTWLEEGTDKAHGMLDRKLLEQLITIVQQGQQWVRDLQRLLDTKSKGYSDLSERLERERKNIMAVKHPRIAHAEEVAQRRKCEGIQFEINALERALQQTKHRYAETYDLLASVEDAFFTDATKRSMFFAFMRTYQDAYDQRLTAAQPNTPTIATSLTRLSLFQCSAAGGGAAAAATVSASLETHDSAQVLLSDIQTILVQERGRFTVTHVNPTTLSINCAPPEGQSITANYTQTMARLAENFTALCQSHYPQLQITVAGNQQRLNIEGKSGDKAAIHALYEQLSELAGAPDAVWKRHQSTLYKTTSKKASKKDKQSKPQALAEMACAMQ